MAIPEDIVTAVASTNLKNVGEAPAFYSSLAMADAIDHRRAMQQITLAATGSIVKHLTEVDPAEAVAVLKATSGNEVASQMAQMLAALNSGQQGVKSAQSTPPTT